jgi:hypothetical protein
MAARSYGPELASPPTVSVGPARSWKSKPRPSVGTTRLVDIGKLWSRVVPMASGATAWTTAGALVYAITLMVVGTVVGAGVANLAGVRGNIAAFVLVVVALPIVVGGAFCARYWRGRRD